MTHYEKLIAGVILGEIDGLTPEEAAARLLTLGLLNHRTCERRAVRAEIDRMAHEGMPRCEAMHVTADTLCCSYEKVRSLYYKDHKS